MENKDLLLEITSASDDCAIIPEEEFVCELPDIDEAKMQKRNRKYITSIITHIRLIRYIRWYTSDGRTTIFIPQTNKYILRGYDTDGILTNSALKGKSDTEKEKLWNKFQYKVSRGIDCLEKLNVIAKVGDYIPHKTALHYTVNLNNLRTVEEIYKRESAKVSPQPPQVTADGQPLRTLSLEGDWRSFFKLGFNANSSEVIPEAIYEDVDSVLMAIDELEPIVPHYRSVVEQLNEKIQFDEEKIRFSPFPRFSAEGNLTKIGIRATSGVCQYTSLEKQFKRNPSYQKKDGVIYREDYLQRRFGDYEEFDVKASVPRVARSMKFQKEPMYSERELTTDYNEDLYETMFGQFVDDYNKCFNASAQSFRDDGCRNYFKLMFMRLYFGGSPKQIRASLLYQEKHLKQTRGITYQPYTQLEESGIDLEALIAKWQSSVVQLLQFTPQKRDTKVFLHESCIYLEVRAELQRRGIDVVQVYDGFFFKKGTMPKDMKRIIEDARIRYQQEICTLINSHGDSEVFFNFDSSESTLN